MKEIAENGKKPRVQVRAALETVDVRQGAKERLLHEVVGAVDLTRTAKSRRLGDWERRRGGRREGPAPASSHHVSRLSASNSASRSLEAVGHRLLDEIVVHRPKLIADPRLDAFGRASDRRQACRSGHASGRSPGRLLALFRSSSDSPCDPLPSWLQQNMADRNLAVPVHICRATTPALAFGSTTWNFLPSAELMLRIDTKSRKAQ